jgi:hypothetical protein
MVWSQYVDEANIGFDAYVSDDDEHANEHTPLNIEDWEVEYSDELWYMWNVMNTLLHDAYINHSGKFCDFVDFCYVEHDSYHERVSSEHEEHLHYIWKRLRRIINDNDLHEYMMRGATFYHFLEFTENYMSLY